MDVRRSDLSGWCVHGQALRNDLWAMGLELIECCEQALGLCDAKEELSIFQGRYNDNDPFQTLHRLQLCVMPVKSAPWEKMKPIPSISSSSASLASVITEK